MCVHVWWGRDLSNVEGFFWDHEDHGRMILQNLGSYRSLIFQERNHGRSNGPARKLTENVKVWVRSGKGMGTQKDPGQRWGHPGIHSGAALSPYSHPCQPSHS